MTCHVMVFFLPPQGTDRHRPQSPKIYHGCYSKGRTGLLHSGCKPSLLHLPESTHRTYKAGVNRYLSFCHMFNVSIPFPVSESILCYFVVSLAEQGLAPARTWRWCVMRRSLEAYRRCTKDNSRGFCWSRRE